MEDKWFYEVPDFLDQKKWIEERPFDCASDEIFSKPEIRTLGTAPDHLYLGMVIRRRNRNNPKMIVDEYRLRHGREAFILKWWMEDDENMFGIAGKDPEGNWVIRRPGEILVWILTYNKEKHRIKHFGIAFRKRKKGELN